MQRDVLVIGGGIAGLQAALELAGAGYPVHLVTDEANLGGKLIDSSDKDKQNACVWGDQVNISALYLGGNLHASSTVLGSLITRATNNPLVHIYTSSKLVELQGDVGHFQATISDAQAGKLTQKLVVGAVILAAGFSMYDVSQKGELGYGYYKNVVTSLEFEHLLSESRYRSECIRRPSDGKCAEKIAFIQCVGSRDVVSKGEYCSAICCMFTAKEAILAKEFAPKTDVTVFYLDLRACGKNFDTFLSRAQELGTRYVRTMISEVKEDPVTEKLSINYAAATKPVEEDFDLVVLATGIRPSARLQETAGILRVPLNDFGFVQADPLDPVVTKRPGVFSVGGSQGPLDVPETMALASAAAAATARALGKPEGRPARKPVPERDISKEPVRVGIFLCKGGLAAMGADSNAVAETAQKLPGVSIVECDQAVCQPEAIAKIQKLIATQGLNRIVVAPCVLKHNLNLFQETVQAAGLNRMLVEMATVPLKAWDDNPDKASGAANQIVTRAVSDVTTYKPLKWHAETVVPYALIVGGGVSGMATALALADRGFGCTLVEKNTVLGGYVRDLTGSLETQDLKATIENLEKQVEKNDKIEVLLNSEVVDFKGRQGQFVTTVATEQGKTTRKIEHGVVILSTGTTAYTPTEYLYGQDQRVITGPEAMHRLADGRLPGTGESTYVFIQCVGSRNEEHKYCSRTCCAETVYAATKIKEQNPDANVYVLSRDIRTPGYLELKYREARKAGVVFVHYEEADKPVLQKDSAGNLTMKVKDPQSGLELDIRPDQVILAVAQTASPAAGQLADLFKIQVNADGFLSETHSNFGTIAFPGGGIFITGAAHGPKSVVECLTQAKGVAGRAARILAQPMLMMGGMVAEVEWEKCAACLTCVRTCPYGIPQITREKKQMGAAYIPPADCRGCGMCASECPNKAIFVHHYQDDEVLARVKTALTEVG
ncbi:FAD-dependent oxidoreductase [Sporomusa acidovorans]|uniref:tRNA 5-methylaminomethyl-2-thiouridine biosynthesis bifunctional protein MnmC n=1 Tax=Sporomusa acidovorans (strain ATCC 49682 / DSM 3132 / Mol) TaxID=1123286 RepID=A0ABZ3J0J3_SPOA4|nr:FAD-dependent oxidoreductase [Sporomusa acidovorans]OZC22447.1 tRNA 5-methylaminomethyl-2-thiouridine biosynthesis bifunctional protein MnmC [Sporomusa acidovorans DSM 3132]SDE74646.1 heterodisulfide reductase subunit A [Sporomusa acidovorans]